MSSPPSPVRRSAIISSIVLSRCLRAPWSVLTEPHAVAPPPSAGGDIGRTRPVAAGGCVLRPPVPRAPGAPACRAHRHSHTGRLTEARRGRQDRTDRPRGLGNQQLLRREQFDVISRDDDRMRQHLPTGPAVTSPATVVASPSSAGARSPWEVLAGRALGHRPSAAAAARRWRRHPDDRGDDATPGLQHQRHRAAVGDDRGGHPPGVPAPARGRPAGGPGTGCVSGCGPHRAAAPARAEGR